MKGISKVFKIVFVLSIFLFTLSFLNAKQIKAIDTNQVLVGNDFNVASPSNGSFTYPVKILEGSNVASLQMSLYYNTNYFTLESYNDLGNDLVVNTTIPGVVTLNFSTVNLDNRLNSGDEIIGLVFRTNHVLSMGYFDLICENDSYNHKFGSLDENYNLVDIPNFYFSFSQVNVRKLGDVDNDNEVTIFDATLIQMHLVGLSTLTMEQLASADVDGNGIVNIFDATVIRLVVAGLRQFENEETFTVRFFDFYGNLISTVTVNKGGSVNPPQTDEIEGMEFVGWDRELYNIQSDLDVFPVYTTVGPKFVHEVLGLPAGSTVQMEGHVYYLVQDENLNTTGFYLEDYHGGKIYCYLGTAVNYLELGDYVRINGVFEYYFVQPEITNITFEEYYYDNYYPQYYSNPIPISEILNMDHSYPYYYGNLHEVYGTITLEEGSYFIVDSEGNKLKLKKGSTFTDQNGVYTEDFKQHVGKTGRYKIILSDYHTTEKVWRVYTIPNTFSVVQQIRFHLETGEVFLTKEVEDGWRIDGVPQPPETERTFLGWFTEPELINKFDENEEIYTSYDLYPKFIVTDEVERNVNEFIDFPAGSKIKTSGVIVTFTYDLEGLINGMYIKDSQGDLIYIYDYIDYSNLAVGDFVRLNGEFAIYYYKPELIDITITEVIKEYENIDFSMVNEFDLEDLYELDRYDYRSAGKLVRVFGTVVLSEGKYFIFDDYLSSYIQLHESSEYTEVGSEMGPDYMNLVGKRGEFTIIIVDFNENDYYWRALLIPNSFVESTEVYYGIEFRPIGEIDFGYDGYMKVRLNEISPGVYGELNLDIRDMSMELRFFRFNGDGTYTYYPEDGYVGLNTEGQQRVNYGGFIFYENENLESADLFDYHGEIVSFDQYAGFYSGYRNEEFISLFINITGYATLFVNMDGQIFPASDIKFINKYKGVIKDENGEEVTLDFSSDASSISLEGDVFQRDLFFKNANGEYLVIPLQGAFYSYIHDVSLKGVVIDIYNNIAIIDDGTARAFIDLGENAAQIGDYIHVIGKYGYDKEELSIVENLSYFEILETNHEVLDEDRFISINGLGDEIRYDSTDSIPLVRFNAFIKMIDGNYYIEVPYNDELMYVKIYNVNQFDLSNYENTSYDFYGHLGGVVFRYEGVLFAKEITPHEVDEELMIVSDVEVVNENIFWNYNEDYYGFYVFLNGNRFYSYYPEFNIRYFPEGEYTLQIQAATENGLSALSPSLTFEKAKTIYEVSEIYEIGRRLYDNPVNNTSIEGIFAFKGEITEITNYIYGNMYIADEYGNRLFVYGVYGLDGEKFELIADKPKLGETIILEGTVNYFNGLQLKNATYLENLSRTYKEGLEVYAEYGKFIDGESSREWVPAINYLDYPMIYDSSMDAYVYRDLHVTGRSWVRFVIVYNGEVTRYPNRPTAFSMQQNDYVFDVLYTNQYIDNEIDLRYLFNDHSYPFKIVMHHYQEIYNEVVYYYEQTAINISDEAKLLQLETLFNEVVSNIELYHDNDEELNRLFNEFMSDVDLLINQMSYYIEIGRFVNNEGTLEWVVSDPYINHPLTYDSELEVYRYTNLHLTNSQAMRLVIVNGDNVEYFPGDKAFRFGSIESKFDVYVGFPSNGEYYLNLSDFWKLYNYELYINLTDPQHVFNSLFTTYTSAVNSITDPEILQYLEEKLYQFINDIEYYLEDVETMYSLITSYEQLVNQCLNPTN